MDHLELLGVALGLSALAGINLYLTVFAAGLAIRFEWIVLSPQYQQLEILGHPAILIVSGILFFAEFFADKVPWFDSLWDSVHTFIRPVGGALLAVQALGTPSEAYDVVVALLAGGISLTTHSVKSGIRLAANTSPEPFSNVGLSLAEDVAVVGGLALIYTNPVIALIVFVIAIALAIWLLPRMLHTVRAQLWLAWRKLKFPARIAGEPMLPSRLPHQVTMLLHRVAPETEQVAWAVKGIVGRIPGAPKHYDVWLIALEGENDAVYVVSKRTFGGSAQRVSLLEHRATAESRFLSEALVIFRPDGGEKLVLHFDKPRAFLAELVARDVEKRIAARTRELDGSNVAAEPSARGESRFAPEAGRPEPEAPEAGPVAEPESADAKDAAGDSEETERPSIKPGSPISVSS